MGFLNRLFDAAARRAEIPEITSVAECQELMALEFAILFKHSEACDLSQDAYHTVSEFQGKHPEAALRLISVLDSRPVALFVEEQTGVRHESPQILALRNGKVIAHASHRNITQRFLEKLVDEAELTTTP